MHIDRRRAFESADYDGWRIGLKPIISPPCRCERPAWRRDELVREVVGGAVPDPLAKPN
jgi:hypothetical protein